MTQKVLVTAAVALAMGAGLIAQGRRPASPAGTAATEIGGKYDPKVPPPWGDAANWWIHQYQGDSRGMPGFFQVDMNRFHGMVKGATGERVNWVQRRLGIDQSGSFDDAMLDKVKGHQSSSGLDATGIIDPKTFATLCWLSH